MRGQLRNSGGKGIAGDIRGKRIQNAESTKRRRLRPKVIHLEPFAADNPGKATHPHNPIPPLACQTPLPEMPMTPSSGPALTPQPDIPVTPELDIPMTPSFDAQKPPELPAASPLPATIPNDTLSTAIFLRMPYTLKKGFGTCWQASRIREFRVAEILLGLLVLLIVTMLVLMVYYYVS